MLSKIYFKYFRIYFINFWNFLRLKLWPHVMSITNLAVDFQVPLVPCSKWIYVRGLRSEIQQCKSVKDIDSQRCLTQDRVILNSHFRTLTITCLPSFYYELFTYGPWAMNLYACLRITWHWSEWKLELQYNFVACIIFNYKSVRSDFPMTNENTNYQLYFSDSDEKWEILI